MTNLYQPIKKFIDNLQNSEATPIYELTPEQARQELINIQQTDKTPPPADIREFFIPLGVARKMKVLVVKPVPRSTALPCIFYIHGGGWVMGDETTHNSLIRKLANDVPANIVFPLYTLAPETQYPQTTNDLFKVLQYIHENNGELGIDTSNLAVAGDSAGGNMATVMTMLSKKNNNQPPIDFQLLLYPVTDDNFKTPSYKEFANGPWLTKKAMQWFWQNYAPDKKLREEIYACPLKAVTEDLEDLPSTLVITAENDVLRDEGEAYAQKLNDAGVTVGAIRVNGTIHDFLMLNDLAQTEPTHEGYLTAVSALRDALSVQN